MGAAFRTRGCTTWHFAVWERSRGDTEKGEAMIEFETRTERQRQIYRDYCETRRAIQSPPYNDPLDYLPNQSFENFAFQSAQDFRADNVDFRMITSDLITELDRLMDRSV